MCSAGAVASGGVEFRCDDDAWYNVTVKLEGDVLRIGYCGFLEQHDDVINANDFRRLSELRDFEARFRPVSRQLQDTECRSVDPGMAVCASYSSRADDVRFYDALVEGHGPISGNLTMASIANMCQVQSGEINDTVLATFFSRVREKIETRMNKGDTCSEGRPPTHSAGTSQKDNCSPKLKRKLSFLQRMNQETRRAKRSSGILEPCEGIICYLVNESNLSVISSSVDSETYRAKTFSPIENMTLSLRESELMKQDTDIGGMKYQYMILLDNLDKRLSPVKLAKFLHGQTSILPRAYIFPSSSAELYARGAVVLNCRKNLERLFGFLDNPDHVIVSSQGRPLVVTGRVTARHDTFGTLAAGAMVLDSENIFYNEKDSSVCCDLKVVRGGTEEYLSAKQMKELFMEFLRHQRRLLQRLAMEESKIYCSVPLQYKM